MKNTLAMIMLLAAYAMTRVPVEALSRASHHLFGLLLLLQMTFWGAYAAQCFRELLGRGRKMLNGGLSLG